MERLQTVYAVFREGVYRHECAGIFTSETVARNVADNAANADIDDHHEYCVVPFILDLATRWGGKHWNGASWIEAEPIYRVRSQRKKRNRLG